jgi:hypothetical protein
MQALVKLTPELSGLEKPGPVREANELERLVMGVFTTSID